MNFRHLEVFYAVMTCGTVTEAARQLGVSQPSVTTTLQQAEARLGIGLFRRESGRLVPTAEARILFEEAERAHDALGAFRVVADRLREGEEGGHLRVAAIPTLSLELLPDAIARFASQQEGFSYSVSTLNTEEMLQKLDARTGAFDLGFTLGNFDGTGHPTEHIGEIPLLAVLPADWGIDKASPLDLAMLEERPYLAGFDSTTLGQLSRTLFSEAGIEPCVVGRVHTHHVAGRLAARGLGYALLDALTVRALQDVRPAPAVTVHRLKGDPTTEVTAVFQARRTPSAPLAEFLGCFRAAFDALASTGGLA